MTQETGMMHCVARHARAARVLAGLLLWLFAATGRAVEWFPDGYTAHVREDGVVTPVPVAPARRMVTPPYLPPDGPTNPMGVARGVVPGRVAWVYDQRATLWNGSSTQYWADAGVTDLATVQAMLAQGLQRLTATTNDAAAWDAMFRQFNGTNNHGYLPGEKVVVKANLVNHSNYASKNNLSMVTPQAIYALLDQLVNHAGVPQTNITVYESLLRVGDQVWNLCHPVFPDVHYADGYGQYGRELCVKDYSEPIYTSNGIVTQYPPTCVTAARYMINLAVLKSHEPAFPAGSDAFIVSLCAKNHFGSLCGSAQTFHPYLEATNAYGTYHILPDLMEHEHLDGKTLLFMLDGLYGGLGAWNAFPERWQMSPFNNDWPSSLLLSMDGVALDSVGMDFLQYERAVRGVPMRGSVDSYLHEAAQITNPPSDIVYDPDHNGPPARSLGVHEHWTSPLDKRYARNLDSNVVNGIELVPLLLPAAPLIEFATWSLTEIGNSNGVFEPGEAAAVQVVLRNSSPVGDLSNSVMTLVAPAGLDVSNPVWAAGELAHMARVTNAQPFVIVIATNCPAGPQQLSGIVAGDDHTFTGVCSLTVTYLPYPRVATTNIMLALEGAPVAGIAVVLSNVGPGALTFEVLTPRGGSTNYLWRDSDMPGGPAFSWIDIAGIGTPLPMGDDVVSNNLQLRFAFPYYQRQYTSCWVSSNGRVGFVMPGNSAYSNTGLPAGNGGPCLAPFWDDLDPRVSGADIRFHSDGARAVVSWLNVPRISTAAPLTFQAVFSAAGTITFQYLSLSGDLTSATVGIQSSNAPAPAVQVAFNQAYLHDSLAVQFSAANGNWLSVTPAQGVLPAHSVTSLWLSADGTGMTAGVYRSTARIAHNGTEPPLDIAVEFIVPEPAWMVVLGFACCPLRRAGARRRRVILTQ
jgi:hypothetical protein